MSASPPRRRRQQQEEEIPKAVSASDNHCRAAQTRDNNASANANANADSGTQKGGKGVGFISGLDILRLVTTAAVLALSLSYYLTSGESVTFNHRPWFTHLDRLRTYAVCQPQALSFLFPQPPLSPLPPSLLPNKRWGPTQPVNPSQLAHTKLIPKTQLGPLLLTPSQLSLYNGTSARHPIYLSINGTIFDVSASPHTYGPGGSYQVFAGRDATRAFVTGCFQTDLTGDLRGVERMFIPVEDDDDGAAAAAAAAQGKEGGAGEEGNGATTTTTRAQRKIRAEQERREARKKVQREVEKWLRFYRDHVKYFEVGRVVVDDDDDADADIEGTVGEGQGKRTSKKQDIQYEGEVPALCEAAERARPKRSQLNAAAAAAGGAGGAGGKGKSVFRTKKTQGGNEGGKPV